MPYVLFMVKARLLPKELSTWVCTEKYKHNDVQISKSAGSRPC